MNKTDEFMIKKLPSKLYKYQSYTLDALNNLRTRCIYFAKPEKLNDPFDLAIPFLLTSATSEQWENGYKAFRTGIQNDLGITRAIFADKKYLTDGKPNQQFKDDMRQGNIKNIVDRRDKYKNEGVACFSKELKSILMWSHYANGHRGFCLEFDTNYPPFNDPQRVHKVIYQNTYPTLNPVKFLVDEIVPATPLITKSQHWKYEKEWRLLFPKGNTLFKYDPRALTAIYFGCLMPDNQKSQIASMPATSAPSLFCMKRSELKFGLEIEPYIIR